MSMIVGSLAVSCTDFEKACAGAPCLMNTVRGQPCSTASIAGANAVYGMIYMQLWQAAVSRRCLRWWTARRLGHIDRRRAQKGEQNQAIGRSRGGRTTKIHALCDPAERLYALLLTGGHVHDLHGARALLTAVPTPRYFLGDKAYDSNDIRAFLAAQASDAVIPPKVTRLEPPPFDL